MSEVLTYREIALGDTEKYFLRLFSIFEEMSAFNIYLYLQRTEKETGINSMAYVNVRKRILRLNDLGLVEAIKENHRRRNAIKYRLTSHGLFQRILMMPEYLTFPQHLKPFRNTMLLQTILYQFFEEDTLDYFNTIYRGLSLSTYLGLCCKAIISDVESFRHSRTRDKEKYMTLEHISALIEAAINNFILTIVLSSAVKNVVYIMTDSKGVEYTRSDLVSARQTGLPDDKDSEYVYPVLALAKDKKFTSMLDALKKEFDKGYKNLR